MAIPFTTAVVSILPVSFAISVEAVTQTWRAAFTPITMRTHMAVRQLYAAKK